MENIFERTFFTSRDRFNIRTLQNLLTSVYSPVHEQLPHVVLRTNALSSSNNIDTFTLTTSAHGADKLIYTSGTDLVNLNVKDGGSF